MGYLLGFLFFILVLIGCGENHTSLSFQSDRSKDQTVFQTEIKQGTKVSGSGLRYLSFSLNLPTKIEGCGLDFSWTEPNLFGFPHAWKFTILPFFNDTACLLKVTLLSTNQNANLNLVYPGTQADLISQRLREDSAMLLQGCILSVGSILMGFATIFRIRFRLFVHLGMIFFLLTLYSFSVANSSLQILFPNTTHLWPFLFYVSLYFLPYFFCSMAIMIFTAERRRVLRQLQRFFLFFPFTVFLTIPFYPDLFDFFFLLYHILVSAAILFFCYLTKKDWYSFIKRDKILIIGILIFFVLSIGEIVISRYTGNMSVPLVPWGGFFLLLSLFSLAFSEYHFYSQRLDSILWAQNQRKNKQSQEKGKRLAGINKEEVLEKIRTFMEIEKGYVQEDLNLTNLAKFFSVRPDQLSALINETYKKSFNRYLNEFRIKEVQRLIEEGTTRKNMLHLAFRVGFQSKSVFNQEFKRILGVTPTEYAKRKLDQAIQDG
jgi:AraC-like DNA-binding protein